MTMVSTINCVAVAFLATSVSGARITFNMNSDGEYWWGGRWTHAPDHGNTNDCVCIKGFTPFPGVKCFKGIRNSPTVDVPFDIDLPIDITTYGSDGLWVDRFIIDSKGRRFGYGADDTRGWCLSSEENEKFDQYATHGGCRQTLSFHAYPKKEVRGYRSTSGFNGGRFFTDREKTLCAKLKGHPVGSSIQWGRRRVEGSEGEGLEAPTTDYPAHELETVEGEYNDPDPTGDNPTQAHNHVDALVLERLRQEIMKLVRDNSEVTDAQIDHLLNLAMLDVEHQLEREENEGEVLEPEGFEGVIVSADGTIATKMTPEALDGSTTTNSKNERNVQGRLQDLEESP